MATLETLHFDNLALKKLPLDPEKENFVRQVWLKHDTSYIWLMLLC